MANIRGTDNNDRLRGTSSDDDIIGLAGNDALFGRAGNDNILGGLGDDILIGSQGMDTLVGGMGNDRLKGGTKTQELGLIGAVDNLSGGDGNDRIFGGFDVDYLSGGSGADRFIYRDEEDSESSGGDTIADFEKGIDRIVLQNNLGIDTELQFVGQSEFSGTAGEIRFVIGGGESQIRIDLDGDRIMDFRIIFNGEIQFQRNDFVF